MKNVILIAMGFVLLTLLIGCGKNNETNDGERTIPDTAESAHETVNTETDDFSTQGSDIFARDNSDNSNYSNTTVPAEVRDSASDVEEMAMKFVDAVFFYDYETVISMTDLASLSPAAPLSDDMEHITEMIVDVCTASLNSEAFVTGIEQHGGIWTAGMYFWAWSNRAERKQEAHSVGILNTEIVGEKTQITVAHYGADTTFADENGNTHIMVAFNKDSNGNWKVCPADIDRWYVGAHTERLEYLAPVGTAVEFRGKTLTPDESERLSKYDVYYLDDFRIEYPEPVTIKFGEGFPDIHDWLLLHWSGLFRTNGGEMGPPINRTGTPQLDLVPLGITDISLAKLRDEVASNADRIMKAVYKALADDSYNDFSALLDRPERFTGGWDEYFVNSPWSSDILKEVEIKSIEILQAWTVNVKCNLHVTNNDGIRFVAETEFSLKKVNGTWLINSIDHRILGVNAPWKILH